MHTTFCDGRNTPEEMVLSAIKKGFKTIGFSGHSYAKYYKDCCMNCQKTAAYMRTIASLKEKYKDIIKIYAGVERDIYSPIYKTRFDYSIGSVHYIRKEDDYLPVDFKPDIFTDTINKLFDGDVYSLAENYYKEISNVVNATGCNIIGHFDLITKFNENDCLFDTSNERYINAWQKAVDSLLIYGIPFEINFGAISRGYRSQPYPAPGIRRYIAEHGGCFVLSSDAHSAENIGFGFDEWEERLRAEGLRIVELTF